ncbi:MAG: GNVR domain-containing protein, partial [Saprospiraceae bacterium]
SNTYNLTEVLKTIPRWKRSILTVTAIAFIGSVIITLMMDNYYQSTTEFYAANPDLAKPEPVGRESGDRDYYGEDEDRDRVLSIAESGQVLNYLIQKYDLYEHYDIDTSSIRAPYTVAKKLGGLYEVIRTKFGSIKISVEDKDPKLAAVMANDARTKVEEISRVLIKGTQNKQINSFRENIKAKEAEIKTLGDTLQNWREEYAIYNTITQSEVLPELVAKAKSKKIRMEKKLELLRAAKVPRDTIIYLEAEIAGLTYEEEGLTETLKTFNKGMGKIQVLTEQHEEARNQLALDKERLKQLEAVNQSDFNAIYIVEEATVPIVKSKPKRSILVIAATMVAFFFSVLGVLLLEIYRKVNWREIWDAE